MHISTINPSVSIVRSHQSNGKTSSIHQEAEHGDSIDVFIGFSAARWGAFEMNE
jgi:hypothetical protein